MATDDLECPNSWTFQFVTMAGYLLHEVVCPFKESYYHKDIVQIAQDWYYGQEYRYNFVMFDKVIDCRTSCYRPKLTDWCDHLDNTIVIITCIRDDNKCSHPHCLNQRYRYQYGGFAKYCSLNCMINSKRARNNIPERRAELDRLAIVRQELQKVRSERRQRKKENKETRSAIRRARNIN